MTEIASAEAADAGAFIPHTLSTEDAFARLDSSPLGLSVAQAQARLRQLGPNTLPRPKPPGIVRVFLRQFLNPLIYILCFAAAASAVLGHWSDAGFIFVVLLANAAIGTAQEASAERAAVALRGLVASRARVQRGGDAYELNAESLVPGDVVLMESGDRVPADIRLVSGYDLAVNESTLTGESMPVTKHPEHVLPVDAVLGDRTNMAYAGTLVVRGRGQGVVTHTGLHTEVGRIAESVLGAETVKPPLLVRMERFTTRIAISMSVAVVILAAVVLARGASMVDVFLMATALAVAAIPEGLPVALTVALAIGMRRMARRNVIVRKLVAVEALGSCTYIASDKTGTLTVNELTVRMVAPPLGEPWPVSGEGTVPEGEIEFPVGVERGAVSAWLERLCRCAVLANEGFLGHRDGAWTHHGDAVDVALLVMARKAGVNRADAALTFPQVATIPFESERRYSATLNRVGGDALEVHVKGAFEHVLPMCALFASPRGVHAPEPQAAAEQARALAEQGYRVLALAAGPPHPVEGESFGEQHLQGLTLLGLVGLMDPLRPQAAQAVAKCARAGVRVAMVTGDHPATALTIARELGLADSARQVATGPELADAECRGPGALDALVRRARVFARVSPEQKLGIVNALGRLGHFVAVTGDGVNDAPALRAAHVGVAMGRSGTDVARETAALIITDDNFASIVAGIEEGRVAYANVRKVIFLLISTGSAEIVLFVLALAAGLPLPLVAVQLLWLNLVTNGIQDMALAFDPAEGDELARPPRPPKEPIFNRLMLERVTLSALTIGSLAFAAYYWFLDHGWTLDAARNGTLLLMVLFENVHVFNSRSEQHLAVTLNPLRNPLLLFGTLTAQLVHIGAMYTPGLRDILGLAPVSLKVWAALLGVALVLLVVVEMHKWWWARRSAMGIHIGG